MKFTFEYLRKQYIRLKELGYTFITCEEYFHKKGSLKIKAVVNRIDIDFSTKKTEVLLDIYKELGIKGSFFLRLHAPEYNPFSFESYRIIKRLISEGHELGYHSEVIDQSVIWSEDSEECLLRDLKVMEAMFDIQVKGVASHGGMTGLNNLDFWKNRKASDYELLYEGYDTEPSFNLFNESLYVSDSEWTRWKAYDKGKLLLDDRRSPSEHAEDGHGLIHLLIHPDTYFKNHFYE